MKTTEEKIKNLDDRKANLFLERLELNEMVNSMEKQIHYLNKRLEQIEIENNDINDLRSLLNTQYKSN